MPSFDYSAIDRQGNSVQGQIQAATRDEAALNLTRTGLLVSRLAEAGAPPIQQRMQVPQRSVAAPPTVVKQNAPPVVAPPPAQRSQATRSVSRPSTPPAKKSAVRTKAGRDKDLYFLFSQLQSYARSGANPVEALTNLSKNCPREDYRESLQEAADAAKEGRPISEVLERYVDLYPPNVVGMVRAAEYGGFYPEAYDIIADQAHASHKFRIWFKWLLGIAIMVGACIPMLALMLHAGLDSWDAQEKSGGTAPGWGTLFSSVGHEFAVLYGPLTLVLCIAIWFFAKYWQGLPRRETRHRLALLVPSVNKRARAESLSVFAWTMSNLAKTGLAPRTVWELSTATIPNQAIRSQLEETGKRMSEQTKLSEAMSMSRQMPEEYAPIVQTGEVTGDVPGALMRASSSQMDEFKSSDQGSKARVGCWMFLLMGIGSAIMFGMFYGWFYPRLFQKIAGE